MFYRPRRTRNLYNPTSSEPFRLSRSKLEQYMRCPRCFWLDGRFGIEPPSMPFTLNTAVDTLLKKEFDIHRAKNQQHPLMAHYGIDAVPFQHPQLDEWRDARSRGITYHHEPTNFFVTGGIDDVWVNSAGELMIVDYKATAKNGEVGIDADWQISYKRQVEIYQWLFRRNGFRVSNTAYFVYANGITDREAFDGKLEFDVKIIPYEGSDGWIEEALRDAQYCLMSAAPPASASECEFCAYRQAAGETLEAVLNRVTPK